MTDIKNIYTAIQAISQQIEMVEKSRKNQQQGYSFRGIDDIYNSIHKLMAQEGVFTTSEILGREMREYQTKSGTTMQECIVHIRWKLLYLNGSYTITETIGQGADSGDKACNKAMATAHKYALIQVFTIPTGEEVDTENFSPDRFKKSAKKTDKKPYQPMDSQFASATVDQATGEVQDLVTFGKHKGKAWADLPNHYLDWLVENSTSADIQQTAQKEKDRRLDPETPPPLDEIVVDETDNSFLVVQ